jgi:hypothetical protein
MVRGPNHDSGYVYVYDRTDGKLQNVWTINKHVTFTKSIDPKTGEIIGRNPPITAEDNMFCPVPRRAQHRRRRACGPVGRLSRNRRVSDRRDIVRVQGFRIRRP